MQQFRYGVREASLFAFKLKKPDTEMVYAQKSYQRSRTKDRELKKSTKVQTREELAESIRPTEISNLFKRNK